MNNHQIEKEEEEDREQQMKNNDKSEQELDMIIYNYIIKHLSPNGSLSTPNPHTIIISDKKPFFNDYYNIEEGFIRMFILMMQQQDKRLKQIDFNTYGLHDKISPNLNIQIVDSLIDNETIKKISLVDITQDILNRITTMIGINKTIGQISLNGEKNLDYSNFFLALMNNRHIYSLELNFPRNFMQFEKFCSFISKNHSLKKLKINFSGMRDDQEKEINLLFETILNTKGRISKFYFQYLDEAYLPKLHSFLIDPRNKIVKLGYGTALFEEEKETKNIGEFFGLLRKNKTTIKNLHFYLDIDNEDFYSLLPSFLGNDCSIEKISVNERVIYDDSVLMTNNIDKYVSLLKHNNTLIKMKMGTSLKFDRIFISFRYQMFNTKIKVWDECLDDYDDDVKAHEELKKFILFRDALIHNRSWMPNTHCSFNQDFQRAVFTMCMCLHSKRRTQNMKLPKQLLFIIIRFIDKKLYLFK